MQAHMSTYDLQVSAKAVNELVCQFCKCNLTHRPHKICSQCMVTVYVKDWRENDHKKKCALRNHDKNRMEEMALREPSHMMLASDLSAYRQEVEGAMLGFAFRSAFRLGKEDDLTKTHVLRFFLKWQPTPEGQKPNLRDRFSLYDWKMEPFKTWIEEPFGGSPPYSEEDLQRRRGDVPSAQCEWAERTRKLTGSFIFAYELIAVARDRPIGSNSFIRDTAFTPRLSPYMPLKDINLRQDWFTALKVAVKEPLRPVDFYLLEDLYACQGKEQADAAVNKVGTYTQRRNIRIAKLQGELRIP